jgi:hypothetical protein
LITRGKKRFHEESRKSGIQENFSGRVLLAFNYSFDVQSF